jgi:DNA repair exonuclease SbcCD ATPase subunit
VDDEFVKERSQVISNVELKLAERRREETALEETARRLADQNHLLVQIDTEYATATRNLSSKRNSEIQRLTRKVHDLEEELDQMNRMKTGLNPFSKRAKAHKTAEVAQKLDAAKSELESALQNFTVEQEKLHDEYEKKKQAVIEQVRNLEKDVEVLETDGSALERRVACEALVNAVNAFLQRKASSLP